MSCNLSARLPVKNFTDWEGETQNTIDAIIGDRGRGDTLNSSDGVVPYWTSHLQGAQYDPQAIREVERILKLNPSYPATTSRSANRHITAR